MFRAIDAIRELEKLAESAFGDDKEKKFGNFEFLNDLFGGGAAPIAYDLVKHDDRYELHADTPGIDPDTIDITVNDRELTLQAERRFALPTGATFLHSGRKYGRLEQTIELPQDLDDDSVSADYIDGVLIVTLPLRPEPTARKVTVTINRETPPSSADEQE